MSDACLHTEIKLTAEGPKIIEVNGRVGGGPPVVLDSISEVNLLRVAAEIALGLPVRFDALVPCNGIGYWWYVNPPVDATRVLGLRGQQSWPSRRLWTASACGSRQEHSSSQAEARSVVVIVSGRTYSIDDLAETVALINSTIEVDYETAA